jgi:hypothetical protein
VITEGTIKTLQKDSVGMSIFIYMVCRKGPEPILKYPRTGELRHSTRK